MSTSTKDRTGKNPQIQSPRLLRTSPLTFARYSVPHEKHPEQNEDTILIDQQRWLAAVFDGVGSGPGRLASTLAARVIRRGWRAALWRPDAAELDRGELLQELLRDAHTQIRAAGERLAQAAREAQKEKGEQEEQEKPVHPGTTAVLAAFHKNVAGAYTLAYAHVGDSRIYLLRPHEPLIRLTTDDGYLSLKLQEGLITEEDALRIDQATSPDQLSATELEYFERRNGITQALGSEKPLTIHVNSISIFPGDRVMLCSDGIHDNLTDDEIAELLGRAARTVAAKKIVQRAIACSHQEEEAAIRAKHDDMSAVVVTCNS